MNELQETRSNIVHLQIPCSYCGTVIMEIDCDPDANAVGILTCPECGDTRTFDVTDMLAMAEIADS
jgi:hypothetical protein